MTRRAADMAAIAPVLFPGMKERGAEEGDMLALLAATAAQSPVRLCAGSVEQSS